MESYANTLKCGYFYVYCLRSCMLMSLRWRHNARDGVSNHQPQDCLLNRLFRHRSNKTPKLCVTGLCAGNSSVTGGEFPTQMASNTEKVSICSCFDDVCQVFSWTRTYISWHFILEVFERILYFSELSCYIFHTTGPLWWKSTGEHVDSLTRDQRCGKYTARDISITVSSI